MASVRAGLLLVFMPPLVGCLSDPVTADEAPLPGAADRVVERLGDDPPDATGSAEPGADSTGTEPPNGDTGITPLEPPPPLPPPAPPWLPPEHRYAPPNPALMAPCEVVDLRTQGYSGYMEAQLSAGSLVLDRPTCLDADLICLPTPTAAPRTVRTITAGSSREDFVWSRETRRAGMCVDPAIVCKRDPNRRASDPVFIGEVPCRYKLRLRDPAPGTPDTVERFGKCPVAVFMESGCSALEPTMDHARSWGIYLVDPDGDVVDMDSEASLLEFFWRINWVKRALLPGVYADYNRTAAAELLARRHGEPIRAGGLARGDECKAHCMQKNDEFVWAEAPLESVPDEANAEMCSKTPGLRCGPRGQEVCEDEVLGADLRGVCELAPLGPDGN